MKKLRPILALLLVLLLCAGCASQRVEETPEEAIESFFQRMEITDAEYVGMESYDTGFEYQVYRSAETGYDYKFDPNT